MSTVTWLGSSWTLVPVLAVTTIVLLRRRELRGVAMPWAAYLDGTVLYNAVKPPVGRARPPAADLIGTVGGLSYPSGHATQAVAVWERWRSSP
jgi:undecaprenyl-diphosphatase